MAEEKFYTIEEATKFLGVSIITLKRYIRDGKIKSIIEKHIRLIPEEELIKVSSLKNRKVSSYPQESINSINSIISNSGESINSIISNSGESINSINSIKKVLKVFPNGKVLDNSILRWAKEYVHKFGLPVIPVGKDKRPLIDWKEFQTRYPTDEELEKWFSDGKSNIAIVTGPISGIAVLDIDGEEGQESIKKYNLFIPPTPCVKTGKGYHYYFKYQDGVRNFTKRYPGIDLRGEGGYVVAPPSIHPSGMKYEWLIPLTEGIAELPSWILETEEKKIETRIEGWVEELLKGVEEGQRNDALARLAGHYFGKKLSLEETKAILLDWNRRNKPPLDDEEVIRTVESIYKTDLKNKESKEEAIKPETVITVDGFRSTDFWNSENFVKKYKGKLLHCEQWGSWLSYKDGKWTKDNINETQGLAKKIILSYYQQASQMEEEDKERKRLARHTLKSETQRAVSSMIELSKSDLAIAPEAFNKEPYIVNLKNGTLNLKTMEFWEHRPEDLLTKQMNVNYNPQAICPKWLNFLDKIFDHNQELIEYAQKAVGYSLTGDTGEDCLFTLYGTGQNGKTTFVKTLEDIWGDYAVDTPTETLLSKEREGISNDIARLAGARLVIAIEAQEGRRLNEALIKKLTGRDTMSARFLHHEFFEFETTFKIFIATNHKPVVRENSLAFWRRMRVLPFIVQIPDEEVIPNYEKILLQEREGIFNWALEGFLKWQDKKLNIPEIVKGATQEYKDEMDVLAEFIEEKCIEGPTPRATTKDLYDTYCKWCEENNEKPMSKQAFSRRLEERGYKAVKVGTKSARGWLGIGLKSNEQ